MEKLLLQLVRLSLLGSLFAAVVMLARILFRKAPKWLFCLLWGLVAVRLCCPLTIESPLSLVPEELSSGQILSAGDRTYQKPVSPPVTDKVYATNVYPPSAQASPQTDPVATPKSSDQNVSLILGYLWIGGMAVMFIYTGISYLLLRRKMAEATRLRDNIWQSEQVGSPFVLGLFRPRIYLPYAIAPEDIESVVAHEQAHIRRKDHWWKPLGFLLLGIHWFNPVLWLAYILLCRDIEAACDEKVIRRMDKDAIRAYSTALLRCSVNRRSISACPLAFGEVGVKARIKRVMHYKKPAFWIILGTVLACILLAVCFLTAPNKAEEADLPDIHGRCYTVQEITYEGGMYSFTVTAGVNTPSYALTLDMQLASQGEYGENNLWTRLGKTEPLQLTEENFDLLFQAPGTWADGQSAQTIRKNNARAWKLLYNKEYLYYLLQQKNGDLYLAYGYQGSLPAGFRWLFKLEKDTTGKSGLIACSGDYSVPVNPYSPIVTGAEYVESVYWLVIDPDKKDSVPYILWQNGEAVGAVYFAIDAQTHEALPTPAFSGRSPQACAFYQADTERAYIVRALKGEGEGFADDIYAFGAIFDPDFDFSTLESQEAATPEISQKHYEIDDALTHAILDANSNGQYLDPVGDVVHTESHYILGMETVSGTPTVDSTNHMERTVCYVRYVYGEYTRTAENLELLSSTATVAAITLVNSKDGGYQLENYWEPYPGETMETNIRERFPQDVADLALDSHLASLQINDLESRCLSSAEAFWAEQAGSSQALVAWRHDPSNNEAPAFRIQFDVQYASYDRIVATCDRGVLIDMDSNTNKAMGESLTVDASHALYWSPTVTGGPHSFVDIHFALYNNETPIHVGTISLKGKMLLPSDLFYYVATLDHKNLLITENPEDVGAVVRYYGYVPSSKPVLPEAYDTILQNIAGAYPWNDDEQTMVAQQPELSYMYRRSESLADVGYALMDLDQDGQSELIIGDKNYPYFFDLYTIEDGTAVHLAASGERYEHYLREDGYIEDQWNSSAIICGNDFYKLENGTLTFVERITMDVFHAQDVGLVKNLADATSDNCYFHSLSTEESDYLWLSYQEAMDTLNDYRDSYQLLEVEYASLEDYVNQQ